MTSSPSHVNTIIWDTLNLKLIEFMKGVAEEEPVENLNSKEKNSNSQIS